MKLFKKKNKEKYLTDEEKEKRNWEGIRYILYRNTKGEK